MIPAELIEDLLIREGRATLKMYGSSMDPLLAKGKTVLVQSLGQERIRVGDIVCFRLDAGLISHRVVRISISSQGCSLFLPKGDNQHQFDPWLTRESIVGKVVAIEGRPITGFFWRLANWTLAKISYMEAKFPEWRSRGRVYHLLYRLKTRLGLRRSLYPYFQRFLRYALDALAAKVGSLCLTNSDSRKS